MIHAHLPSRRTRLALIALVVGVSGFSLPIHFELDKSSPAADATVTSPSSIDLWFTQVPQEESTSVRLVDAAGELVPTAGVVQDPEDGKHQSVAVNHTLPAGTYTVAWRSMASDGHVVRDDFAFQVAAEGSATRDRIR